MFLKGKSQFLNYVNSLYITSQICMRFLYSIFNNAILNILKNIYVGGTDNIFKE